jgi:tryptophan synthase alpha chain
MLTAALAKPGAKLMAYFTAGDGGLDETYRRAAAAVAAGADLIELGIPFSDPIADGPSHQAAAVRALAAGTRPRDVLALARRLTDDLAVPVVLLTYMNPLLRLEAAAIREAGVEAVVVPDLAFEERRPVAERLGAEGISLVPFLAPTTPPERMAAIGRERAAFVYLVSVTGVTGARSELGDEVVALLGAARRHVAAPLAVGFGLAREADVRRLAPLADILIVGSALTDAGASGGASAVGELVRRLKAAAS